MDVDVLFARCVDHISLSGPGGAILQEVVNAALKPEPPRPAIIRWYAKQFKARSDMFTSPDWKKPVPELRIIAGEDLRKRALGYSLVEHGKLPDRAMLILEHVGRAGPTGILQVELGKFCQMSSVSVSHYVGNLVSKRLIAKKKVVLTNRKKGVCPNVTNTAIIVLARFASELRKAHAGKGLPGEVEGHEDVNPEYYPTHPDLVDADSVSIQDLQVEQGAERIIGALKKQDGIMSERDLKFIALPDSQRPSGFTEDLYRRRRHRIFRVYRERLVGAGLVEVVANRCVDKDGNCKGMLNCLKLKEKAYGESTLVLKDAYELGEGKANTVDTPKDEADNLGEEVRDGKKVTGEAAKNRRRKAKESGGKIAKTITKGQYLAEVDLIEQVYQLLRTSGSNGVSVPELRVHLDGGGSLTCATPKRIRKIVTAIGRTIPIVQSQKFDGKAMSHNFTLAEFADMDDNISPQNKATVAKRLPIGKGENSKFKSKVAMGRSGMTSLALKRQELVLNLLAEEKAVVMETMGRQIAQMEGGNLRRVDQKIMRKIINSLVLQKQVKVITTIKPTVKAKIQNRIVNLVVLPELTNSSPEVTNAIASICTNALYGKPPLPSKSPGKRKAKQPLALEAGNPESHAKAAIGNNAKIGQDHEKSNPTNRRRIKKDDSIISKNSGRAEPQPKLVSTPPGPVVQMDELTAEVNGENIPEVVGLCANVEPVTGSPEYQTPLNSNAILVNIGKRDMSNNRIQRLTALDYGWMKGKMARVRALHEQLYKFVTENMKLEEDGEDSNQVQCITVENAKDAAAIGNFTIYSCLEEMTVSIYAGIVGIYNDYGKSIDSWRDQKVRDVPELMEKEIKCLPASRQIRDLVKVLVKLNLLVNAEETRFSLSGAGILRSFGKGLPAQVLPHGILFSNREAVSAFWTELYHYSRTPQNELYSEQAIEQDENQAVDYWSYPVPDVYAGSSWNGFVTFLLWPREQRSLEGILQKLSGVPVSLDSSGQYITRDFIRSPLKRFSVEKIVNEACKAPSIDRSRPVNRSYQALERLIVYSRYRADHDFLSEVCRQEGEVEVKCSRNDEQEVPRQEDGVEVGCNRNEARMTNVLRLHRGKCGLTATVESKWEKGKPKLKRRRRSRKNEGSKAKKKKLRNAPSNQTMIRGEDIARIKMDVNLEVCVLGLRDVVHFRAIKHCENGNGGVVDWKVINLFPECHVQAGQDATSNGKMADKDEENMGLGHEWYKGEDASLHRKLIRDLCKHGPVQVILECISLKLACRLAKKREIGTSRRRLVSLCMRLADEWEMLNDLLTAAVLQCEDGLYRNCDIVFKKPRETYLDFKSNREALIRKEFALRINMRMHAEQSLIQQMQLLLQRYRLLLRLMVSKSLWRGFVFCEERVDEIVCAQDERTRKIRVEVMENILLSIVNGSRLSQNSNQVMQLLGKFRQEDIGTARDRLVLREAMTVRRSKDGSQYFAICGRGGACEEGQQGLTLLEGLGNAQVKLRGKLEDELKEGCENFFLSSLGKEVRMKSGKEGVLGVTAFVKLLYFQRGFGVRIWPEFGSQGNQKGNGGKKVGVQGLGKGESGPGDEMLYLGVGLKGSGIEEAGSEGLEWERRIEKENVEIGNVKVRKAVWKVLRVQGNMGATLEEVLRSVTGKDEKKLAVKVVSRMVDEGKVTRIAIEGGDGEWYNDGHVLYVRREASGDVMGGNGNWSGMSIWSGIDGKMLKLYNEVHGQVLDAVNRRPGVLVTEIVRRVQKCHAGICGRAVADLVWDLGRKGLLKVQRVQMNGNGVFGDIGGVEGGWVEGCRDDVGDGKWFVEALQGGIL